MKRITLLIILCGFGICGIQAQLPLNVSYKPLSFEEYVRPYLMYDAAYKQYVEQFYNYMEKLYEQCQADYPNYRLIKLYVDRCLEINNNRMMNGELYDNGELYYIKGIAHIQLNEKQDGINDLQRASVMGYQPAKNILQKIGETPSSQNLGSSPSQTIQYNHGEIPKSQTIQYDYGKIQKGKSGMGEISIRNTSNKPVSIINVISSCGCLIPNWSTAVINPGQSSLIKFKYNTNLIGPINRTITVYFSDGTNIVINVKGKVFNS